MCCRSGAQSRMYLSRLKGKVEVGMSTLFCNRKDLVTLMRESSFLSHKCSAVDAHAIPREAQSGLPLKTEVAAHFIMGFYELLTAVMSTLMLSMIFTVTFSVSMSMVIADCVRIIV